MEIGAWILPPAAFLPSIPAAISSVNQVTKYDACADKSVFSGRVAQTYLQCHLDMLGSPRFYLQIVLCAARNFAGGPSSIKVEQPSHPRKVPLLL